MDKGDTQTIQRTRQGLRSAMGRHHARTWVLRWFADHSGQTIGLDGLVAVTRLERAVVEQVLGELLAAGELERCAGGYRAMKELNHVERNRD